MDPRRLLTVMAQRLYEDIKFVTEQNPTQIVDDDGAKAYNALVSKARKMFPNVENVADFPDWSARTIKYKDALVVAGQFAAMMDALTGNEARVAGKVAAATGTAPRTPVPVHNPPPPRMAAPGPAAPHMPQMPQQPQRLDRVPKTTNPLDEELYGSAQSAPKRNDDGTIPFSLD